MMLTFLFAIQVLAMLLYSMGELPIAVGLINIFQKDNHKVTMDSSFHMIKFVFLLGKNTTQWEL